MTQQEIDRLINDTLISRDFMININARDFNALRKEGDQLGCVKAAFNHTTDKDGLKNAFRGIFDEYGTEAVNAAIIVFAFNPESNIPASAFTNGNSLAQILPQDFRLSFGILKNPSIQKDIIDLTIFFAIKN